MSQNKKVDNIIEGIKELARKDIDKIIKETDEKITSVKEEFETKKREYKDKKKAGFTREAALEAGQLVTNQRLDSRNEILNKKRELIEDTIDSAIEELKKLDKKHYVKFISGLIKQVVLKGDEKIALSASESAFEQKLTSQDLGKMLNKLNKDNDWHIQTAESTDRIDGGFILKAKEYETIA
jgi:vacuolar-type H+-ATPase subunit E/Vma4